MNEITKALGIVLCSIAGLIILLTIGLVIIKAIRPAKRKYPQVEPPRTKKYDHLFK